MTFHLDLNFCGKLSTTSSGITGFLLVPLGTIVQPANEEIVDELNRDSLTVI